MKILMILLCLVTSKSALAFILTYNDFQVKDHTAASVYYARGSCTGIGDSEMKKSIEEAIDKYWNTVSESSLNLVFKGATTVSGLSPSSRKGSILIGCSAMGSSGPNGITYTTKKSGRSLIFLNDTTLQPGGYTSGAEDGILIHEMGHALGLHHSKDSASVMTYESKDWGFKPKHLAEDDKNGIVYLYPQDPELLGLLGGCGIEEAVASSSSSITGGHYSSRFSGLLSFIFGVFIIFVFRQFIRARFWKSS